MSSGGLKFVGDGNFKLEPFVNIFQEINSTVQVLELIVTDGGSGEYNAHYALQKFEIKTRIDMRTWETEFSESSHIMLAEGDMKTTPDRPMDGVATLNGVYTWKNVAHKMKGGLPVVRVLRLNGSGVLPTIAPNVNVPYVNKYLQDGINIHPPNPNGPFPWKEKYKSIICSNPKKNPFSQGCWQPRPNPVGESLINIMREFEGGIKRIHLNTKANSGETREPSKDFPIMLDIYSDWQGGFKEFFNYQPR